MIILLIVFSFHDYFSYSWILVNATCFQFCKTNNANLNNILNSIPI